jgi:indole-3-glycerol phosphate synthase
MKLRLSDLVEAARETTKRRRARVGEAALRADAEELGARSPAGRFQAALQEPGVSVIAEVKGASPLRGALRDPFAPVELAEQYADNGAAAVSVLTEERFFAGSIEHLLAVSSTIELPTLRKDFITELYQIFDAAMAGAGAVLLIAELLEGSALREFVDAATTVGLDALVEFHRPELLVPAVESGSGIVGINNRNLDTLEIDFEHALRLAPELPRDVVGVAESAISKPADVRRVAGAGFGAVLVGTALVTATDAGAVLRELVDAGAAETGKRRNDGRSRPGQGDDREPSLEDLDLPDDIDLDGAVLL